MKQYQLNLIQPTGSIPAPEALTRIMNDVNAVVQATKDRGVWVFNGGLTPPSSATVVRVREEEVLLTDGPFVEGKEHIGGFIVVRAHDLDEALEWAQRLARASTLPIEVRPFYGEY